MTTTQHWTQCFPFPELAEERYFNPFPLVDVTVIDDNELVNHRKIAIMELAMKHKNLREDFKAVTTFFARALIKNNYNRDDMVTILHYLFAILDSTHFKQVIEQLTEQVDNHQETIVNIAQRLRDEGIQQGMQQGEKQAALNIARTLLKDGISVELIMKSTGLSREEILSLQ
ncbi:Rpn family recombination-promoting nuclease/putative transposase [Xenorhabdus szentirmaii]|uniref:Rpn family recombination-promoting nuclease/putative transposase n=1 Tax=Xenorhabdus szentirmaii TaxID=290112 RepID=UPI002B414D2C|nr:Rpn family recombination-promoting nuclease/putative transposase [Xenorhabdus sp. M]